MRMYIKSTNHITKKVSFLRTVKDVETILNSKYVSFAVTPYIEGGNSYICTLKDAYIKGKTKINDTTFESLTKEEWEWQQIK